jgi:hypothetical protein
MKRGTDLFFPKISKLKGWKAKAQVSMEFLMVFGFVMILTIPLFLLYSRESTSVTQDVSTAQASQITRRIISMAETVYALGEPTSVYMKVYFPLGINHSLIMGRNLTLFVQGPGGLNPMTEVATMALNGSFGTAQGIHNIRITAINSSVTITEFSAH